VETGRMEFMLYWLDVLWAVRTLFVRPYIAAGQSPCALAVNTRRRNIQAIHARTCLRVTV